ncbi:MAG: hypothetical protein IJE81_02530 [Oscillospiraceae bacterium]|nr:hypothetical protein [Oscillospiraceae bacterium]MBQ7130715.1 hypothetical protein [Oscillospiraceae bacterium]
MKKAAVILFSVLLLAVFVIGLKVFVIGSPVNGNALAVDVQAHDRQVTIYIDSPDSALAISNIKYRYEGTKLYITVWKVLSSPIHNNGSRCLYYEITDETEIWLGDRLIWSAK